ncbi:hypothetical protein AAG906_000126 [Vitis piasezkii]
MAMALTTKNKIGFIDGTIPRAAQTDLLFNAWNRYNSMKHLIALQQGALDINTYYTRFKVLWEELKNFQPLPICHCGGLQAWLEYQQQENPLHQGDAGFALVNVHTGNSAPKGKRSYAGADDWDGDVIFHETSFPFQSNDLPSPISDFLYDSVLSSSHASTFRSPFLSFTNSNPATSTESHVSSTSWPTRVTKPPTYLQDYHFYSTTLASTSTLYPLFGVLGYDKLSPSHRALVHAISSHVEPTFYTQAAMIPKWQWAMKAELHALEENGTWSLTTLPLGKWAMGCVDYIDTFSPIAKLVTVKLLLALAAIHSCFLVQLDVNNAFLHSDLTDEVYMSLPQGYPHEGETLPSNNVYRLHKSIYGLKQALRQWFAKFSGVLLDKGFTQLASCHSLFTKCSGKSFLALLVYVDDIVIASNDYRTIEKLRTFLNSQFKLKDLGQLKYFLDLEVARSQKGVHPILQYIKGIVGQGLYFSATSSVHLKAFANLDWRACKDTRRSISAMANVTCELIWLTTLLRDFGIQSKEPTTLFCDNEAVLHIAANLVFQEKTKHIEIDCHLIRENIQGGCLKTMHMFSQH